ncbi:hypothetical protein T08_2666, partial [Trichinella sp. T8]
MLIASCVCSQDIYRAQPPLSGSIKADNMAIFVGDQITIDVSKLPRLRPSLISQWPFGVLVRQAASSKYFVDNRHNG